MELNDLGDAYPLNPNGADQHAQDAALREHGPACPVDLFGVKAWSVADPALIRYLLADSRVTKDKEHWTQRFSELDKWPMRQWIEAENLLTVDGQEARRLRGVVTPAFSPRRVAALRPVITKITDRLLHDLASTPPGDVVDLNKLFAEPLPIHVLSEVLGVPDGLRERFASGVPVMFDATRPVEERKRGMADFRAARAELVAIKRHHPSDDLVSTLVSVHDRDPARLSEQELLHTIGALFHAGFETTANLLLHAVVGLVSHPEQLSGVRDGRVGWDHVVEEALRYDSPVNHFPLRFAARDIKIDDQRTIRRGEAIMPAYAAANRHPDYFGADAEEFDVMRHNKEHVAFGYGSHYCPGAHLARAEAAVALPALFDRFPNLRLAVPVTRLQRKESLISNGYLALPVSLHG